MRGEHLKKLHPESKKGHPSMKAKGKARNRY